MVNTAVLKIFEAILQRNKGGRKVEKLHVIAQIASANSSWTQQGHEYLCYIHGPSQSSKTSERDIKANSAYQFTADVGYSHTILCSKFVILYRP